MSERLFIRLGSTQEQPCSWLVWSEQEQEIIASGELPDANSLPTLTERAGNRPVDVLVPATSMMLTQVALPEKGQRQAVKAIPFMLEDNLATDVDNMHVVVGPRDGANINVVAVAHEQMQEWLQWLAQAELKVKNIVPDCLALPLADCQWALLELQDEYLLRTGDGSGLTLPKSWAEFALPQLVAQQAKGTDEETDTSVTVAAYSPDVDLPSVELEQQQLDLPMMVLAKGAINAPLNLLTDMYKPKREYSKHLLVWRNAAIILIAVVVLALANKGLSISQLNSQTAQLRAESEAVFKRVDPSVNRIVNIRSQIDSSLRSLSSQGGGAEFFAMLNSLEPAFKSVPELKPTTLRFDANRRELRMQITAKTYDQVDKFKGLVSTDFDIDGGAINNNEDNITSTITLRSK
ncbi:type II secretion system protein GspL [Shewanella maritima]|uniref:type II secretion system protein GspL n=1 Tax=Shewanella maritima TaxID=2520507 RepID=UPI003734D349